MNWNGLAFILMLLAFVLITIGVAQEIEALWWAGIVLLVIGSLIPPVLKFTGKKEENS